MKWGSEQKLGRKKDELGIGPLINLASMADVVQIDAALSRVEIVNDAVVANSQLEFGSGLEVAGAGSFPAVRRMQILFCG